MPVHIRACPLSGLINCQALAYARATAPRWSLMKKRKCKLAILAIAVLLQVHLGASHLFAEITQTPQTGAITHQETLRGSVTPEREW